MFKRNTFIALDAVNEEIVNSGYKRVNLLVKTAISSSSLALVALFLYCSFLTHPPQTVRST